MSTQSGGRRNETCPRVFGDESGDLGYSFDGGGSSTHFVVTLVLLNDAELLKRKIQAYRESLGPAARRELHFHSMKPDERLHFLRHLCGVQEPPFAVFAYVVNKQALPPPSRPKTSEAYEQFVAATFIAFRNDIQDAIVKMDTSNQTGKGVLMRIKRRVNGEGVSPVIHDNQFEASHTNPAIQVGRAWSA